MTNHSADRPFADLEIHILPQGDRGYPVDISLSGQQRFRGYLIPSIVPWVSSGDPKQDGQRLFEMLFADVELRGAWGEARGQAQQRRIRLWIDVDAAELHAVPWELLQEDTGEPLHLCGFKTAVAAGTESPLPNAAAGFSRCRPGRRWCAPA